MTLQEFIAKALLVPFKPKGRGYEGWDCYAVQYRAYKDILGVELPSFLDDYVDPGDSDASRRVIQDIILMQKNNWEKVKNPKAMDVVLFTLGATQTHLGMMVDGQRFIHCERKVNTVIERLGCAKWKSRVEGIYRLKDKNV